jgi:hypothetical protein
LSLINLCRYLLDRQVATQAKAFEHEGRLYRTALSQEKDETMRELTRPSRLMASNLMLSDHLRKLAATILMVQTMESPRRQGEFATEWRQSAFGQPFCLVWSRKTVDGEEFDGLKPSETVDAEGFSCFGSSKSVAADDFDGLMEQKGLATKVFFPVTGLGGLRASFSGSPRRRIARRRAGCSSSERKSFDLYG